MWTPAWVTAFAKGVPISRVMWVHVLKNGMIALITLTVGYHGCDQEVADSALSGATRLKVSENDYDWLGSGIYFWENDLERARHGLSSPTLILASPLTRSVAQLLSGQ